jgi:hypothetical protein
MLRRWGPIGRTSLTNPPQPGHERRSARAGVLLYWPPPPTQARPYVSLPFPSPRGARNSGFGVGGCCHRRCHSGAPQQRTSAKLRAEHRGEPRRSEPDHDHGFRTWHDRQPGSFYERWWSGMEAFPIHRSRGPGAGVERCGKSISHHALAFRCEDRGGSDKGSHRAKVSVPLYSDKQVTPAAADPTSRGWMPSRSMRSIGSMWRSRTSAGPRRRPASGSR